MSLARSRIILGLVVVLVWIMLVTGCDSGQARPVVAGSVPPHTAERSSVPTPPTVGERARPCTTARSGRYAVNGRSYLLAVPTNPIPPVLLVLNFHGYQQSAAAQERYTGFAAYAAANGIAVATPEGQAGGQWNFARSPALKDDVAFAESLVRDLRARLCDVASVGATGWSDGADMAATLGCAGVVRAVTGAAASIFPVGSCPSPPPVLEIHGTADPFVPYGGGGGSRSGAYANTEAQPTEVRLARWATAAGCPQPRRTNVTSDVERVTWGTCVSLYRVEGGGHTWPGHTGQDPVPGLGAATTSINANQVFVDFFRRHL